MHRVLPALIVLLALAAAAAPATAATRVVLVDDGRELLLLVRGGAGDDRIAVREAGGAALVADPSGVRPGGGCKAAAAGLARCPRAGEATLRMSGGPGDDALSVARGTSLGFVTLRGDGGRDRLRHGARAEGLLLGGPGADVVTGGPARDELIGGPGRDRLDGRGGRDRLSGDAQRGPYARDVLRGGPGRDEAAYRRRITPVTVDLARDRGGGRGERDRLVSIESVHGTEAGDVLLGDRRRNRLTGGRGRDVLVARGGDDVLFPGGDVNDGPDQQLDRIRCGAGDDLVEAPALRELLPVACERIGRAATVAIPEPAAPALDLRRGLLRLRTLCSPHGLGCTRTLAVSEFVADAPLGRSAERSTRGRALTLDVALPPAVTRRLAAGRRVAVTLRLAGCDEMEAEFVDPGDPPTYCAPMADGWSVVLRRPRRG